jgi:hypothetical protein
MGWTQPSVSNPASVGQGGLNDHHEEAREGPKMDIRTLGIDLAKNLFRVHGVDAHGRTVVERASPPAAIAVRGAASTVPGGDGSVRWRTLLGP